MFRTQLLHKLNGGIPGHCFFGLVGGEGRGGSGKSYTLASMAKLTMVMIVITENIAFYNGTDTYYHRSGHLFPVIAQCPCGEVTNGRQQNPWNSPSGAPTKRIKESRSSRSEGCRNRLHNCSLTPLLTYNVLLFYLDSVSIH